jgi:hypothetical protein
LRTTTGAQQFCAIRSYLSTAAKHGLSLFDALITVAESRPWMPAAARRQIVSRPKCEQGSAATPHPANRRARPPD